MPIRLVIKGTVEDARQAAKLRGVHLTELKEGHHGCATGKTGSRFAKAVLDWYVARHETATEEGYAPGSLVTYRER